MHSTFSLLTQKRFLVGSALFGILIFLHPAPAHAATLSLSSGATSYSVGSTVIVEVDVGTPTQEMNAASGVITFPSDLFQFVSASRAGSILNFWPTEPAGSNIDGLVRFEGIALNPGYIGRRGKLVTFTFRAKAKGVATLGFSTSSVLANDGNGTMILDSTQSLSFQVVASPVSPTPTPLLESSSSGSAPLIASPTHPDQMKWYANANPLFVWQVPENVVAIRLLYDKNPKSTPTVLYSSPVINQKQLTNVQDGVWYFHVQFLRNSGWSATTDFRFQIDTTPPNRPIIRFPHGASTTDPRPITLFNTSDSMSGVRQYEVKIGVADSFLVPGESVTSNPYALPTQDPGNHEILVRATDNAGNTTEATSNFSIAGIAVPVIVNFDSDLNENQILRVQGNADPNVAIIVFLKGADGKAYFEKTESNGTGYFELVWSDLLGKGEYGVWAKAKDDHGALSAESSHLPLHVHQTALFMVGPFTITLQLWNGIVSILFAILFFFAGVSWYSLLRFRKRLSKEIGVALVNIHKTFHTLHEDAYDEMDSAVDDRGTQTKKSKHAAVHLEKDFDKAEEVIKKELEKIQKS